MSATTDLKQDTFEAWYDSKPEEIQFLIDEIAARTSFITDEGDYDVFIETLADYGITTPEEFEDRFEGEWEGYGQHILNQFTEQLVDGLGYLDKVPDIFQEAIDFETVYWKSVQYDYVDFTFNENTYVFRRDY